MERLPARSEIDVRCCSATRRRGEIESSIRRRDRRRIIREWALHRQDGIFGTDNGDAEQLFKRSLAILVKARGRNHSDVDEVLRNYAVLLGKMNRGDEATRPEARAKDIHKKANLK